MQSIPAEVRGTLYATLLVVFVLVLVGLIAVDVARGGDPAGWVSYLLAGLGLGGAGMATANRPDR